MKHEFRFSIELKICHLLEFSLRRSSKIITNIQQPLDTRGLAANETINGCIKMFRKSKQPVFSQI